MPIMFENGLQLNKMLMNISSRQQWKQVHGAKTAQRHTNIANKYAKT